MGLPLPPPRLCSAPVLLFSVTQGVARRHRRRLPHAFPEVSAVGDLPAAPRARVGRRDGVRPPQAVGHRRLEGQGLHGAAGVRAVVVLLGRQEGLRGVAARRGVVVVVVVVVAPGLAPPLARGPLLQALPRGSAPPHGLRAALLLLPFLLLLLLLFVPRLRLLLAHAGLRVAHQRGVGDVGVGAGGRLACGPACAGGAGLGGGRDRAFGAVALETRIEERGDGSVSAFLDCHLWAQ